MDEQIVLLDDSYQPIGVAPKLASHHANTPLHLGFSCYIFNTQGQFLLTQRALTKKVWPGVWTNSVCGHPAPDEPIANAVRRRTDYELGLKNLDNLQAVLPDYRYQTPPYNGIIENEFCPVFVATINSKPKPNPDEVAAYRWVNWQDISAEIAQAPDAFSYWFKDQLPLIAQMPVLHAILGPSMPR